LCDSGGQIKEDDVEGACSTHKEERQRNLKASEHLEKTGLSGEIIIKLH
jgi:hypothetical protein